MTPEQRLQIAGHVGELHADPWGYVRYAYKWGKLGGLSGCPTSCINTSK